MYFFLHVLPEVVSAVFSFLVEWFLFQEQPTLYGGTLSPLVTAWLYMAMVLAVSFTASGRTVRFTVAVSHNVWLGLGRQTW